MSEIEKMYENAGIKKVKDYYCPNCETKLEDWFSKHKGYICPNERCDYALCDDEEDFQECLEHLSYREDYPSFTAEKQISLIKFLMKQEDFSWTIVQQGKDTEYVFYVGYEYGSGDFKEFTEAIAGIINNLWQDLTEKERKQIKEILE